MTPELQIIFNAVLSLALAAAGWYITTINRRIEKQDDLIEKTKGELNEALKEMPIIYQLKDDARRFEEAIFKKLDRIEGKIDGKVDKSHMRED